jgi:hypothetical protein
MSTEDEQRIAERSISTMHQSSHYDITGDEVYYPINHEQLRELLGDYLTILDTMNLPDRVHKAVKANMTQTAWRWWDGVYENTTTSYKGCIAPIVCDKHLDSKFYPSNRWGYESEEAYENALPRTQNPLG